jgi:CHAD domain-containing protein
VASSAKNPIIPISTDHTLSSFSQAGVIVPESPFERLRPRSTTREQVYVRETPFGRTLRERTLMPGDPAIYLACRCLLEQFEAVLAEELRAWEGEDPEGVHQMRVATRRLRGALRAFKFILPVRNAGFLNREFRWLAGVLGQVRDLDVYQANLKRYAAEIPDAEAANLNDYREHLQERWVEARKRLLACLASQRYRKVKERFARFIERGPSRATLRRFRTLTIADASRQLIEKRYERVLRRGRRIAPDSPDESFHALRIQCKRLRYLFEFFSLCYGKLFRPYVKRLKKLQDALGEIQDVHVASDELLRYAEQVQLRNSNRGQLIALGQLISGQRRQAAAKREDFFEVWKRFDRKRWRRTILFALGKPRSSSLEPDTREPQDGQDEPKASPETVPSDMPSP